MKESSVKEINIKADTQNLDNVLEFIESQLETLNCNSKVKMKIAVAVEEIFVNIANYAYINQESGYVRIIFNVLKNPDKISITFIDDGMQYNPLETKDPDITLPAEERNIGGLGILLVKKTMDEVTYSFENEKNIITIYCGY